MSRLLCRVLGHRWRWLGWAARHAKASDTEVFECSRCGRLGVEEFGG